MSKGSFQQQRMKTLCLMSTSEAEVAFFAANKSFLVFTWVPILHAQWVQPWTAKQVLPSPTLKRNPLSVGALGHRVEVKSSRLGLTQEVGTQIRTASMSVWTIRVSSPCVLQGTMCLLVKRCQLLNCSAVLLASVIERASLRSELRVLAVCMGDLDYSHLPAWLRKKKHHTPPCPDHQLTMWLWPDGQNIVAE